MQAPRNSTTRVWLSPLCVVMAERERERGRAVSKGRWLRWEVLITYAISSTSSLNFLRLLASIFWSLRTFMATRRPLQRPSYTVPVAVCMTVE